MAAIGDHVPKYRHYKPKNLGVVRIDGRDHYLGKFGSPESYEKYHRVLAERYARGPVGALASQEDRPQSAVLTITELCVGYYRHCERYYVKNGKITNQVRIIHRALKVLRSLYGSTLAKDFAPLALKACRTEFIGQGLARRECNRRTRLIKQAFKWGVSEELVPPSVFHGLLAVSGLAAGRCEARDPKPIGPVPEAIVERTIEHLTPTLEAMVRLQLASAMRPGELVTMRGSNLNMSGAIWEYRPETHKTEHHEGASRVIMLGPKAQEVIRPFLRLSVSGYLFSPRQSEAERNAERRAERKTPLWPSHVKHQEAKKRRRPGRKPLGDCWEVNAYRKAIAQACDAAFPHPTLAAVLPGDLADAQKTELEAWHKAHRWHPNQLRHTAATTIRRQYGAEAAQAVLGHAELSTTEIYAEKSLDAARAIMKEIG
ncbi:MAG: tyrosine-type recombinase/integrase [Fimbriimonadales bacterium]